MKKKTLLTKISSKSAVFACLAGAAVFFAGCSGAQNTDTSQTTTSASMSASESSSSVSESTTSKEAAEASEEKSVKLQVVNKDGKISEYNEKTEEKYLREVLDEISEDSDFTYSGSDSQYGIMIDTVNGERADYTLDGAYWSIYVNDEYANFGADQQPVNDGDTFALKYEKAN